METINGLQATAKGQDLIKTGYFFVVFVYLFVMFVVFWGGVHYAVDSWKSS